MRRWFRNHAPADEARRERRRSLLRQLIPALPPGSRLLLVSRAGRMLDQVPEPAPTRPASALWRAIGSKAQAPAFDATDQAAVMASALRSIRLRVTAEIGGGQPQCVLVRGVRETHLVFPYEDMTLLVTVSSLEALDPVLEAVADAVKG